MFVGCLVLVFDCWIGVCDTFLLGGFVFAAGACGILFEFVGLVFTGCSWLGL